MSDELEAYVRRHGLDEEAAAELRRLFGRQAAWVASTLMTEDWDLPGSESAPATSADASGQPPEPSDDEQVPEGGPAPLIAGRYRDLGRIGQGGMGEVRRVHDLHLDRLVAMKIIRADRQGRADLHARFLEEAHATAQLQHPGIVPVHDQGLLPDGRPWFTMREVHGRALEDVIAALHGPGDGWTLRQVLAAFVTVCQTVAYAHRRGVLHRDLKPSNLMLGELGEVYVLDWGIAKVLGSPEPGPHPRVGSAPVRGGDVSTRIGGITGTPSFMAPEQAGPGGLTDRPAVDVYALGAVLYVVLSGQPPYEGSPDTVLEQLRQGPPPPLETRCDPPPPDELVAICERAMAWRMQARFSTAEDLANAVQDWLTGARRREQALSVLASVPDRARQAQALIRRAEQLRAESESELHGLDPWAPETDKAAGWALADEARQTDRDARLAELTVEQALQAALQIAPDLPEAHVSLVERHLARHRASEDAGDPNGAAVAERLVRTHARALARGHPVRQHAATYLRGDGALTLVTDPPGAEVVLCRHETQNRRLVEVFERSLGRTPLHEVPLPRGSYLCLLRHPDCDEVRYPVEITRLGHWDGVRPGDRGPTPVRLPRRGELGPDEVYVPAGWFRYGGDPLVDSHPRGRAWCDALIVQRFPVTVALLVGFLNHLIRSGDQAQALRIAPQEATSASDTEAPLWLARNEQGLFDLDLLGRGGRWAPDWPAVMVDFDGARACLRWLAERDGRPWRLPGELEWEKAARGVEGRWFPWGNHHDWSWANMRLSSPGQPAVVPVTDFPVDRSVYGIRGFGGSSLDWCVDAYSEPPPPVPEVIPEPEVVDSRFRVVRGGSAKGRPRNARCAYRYRNEGWRRHLDLGMRGFYRPW